MNKPDRPFLKPNPFISLRDPQTGKWCVIFRLPRDRRQDASESETVAREMRPQVEYSS